MTKQKKDKNQRISTRDLVNNPAFRDRCVYLAIGLGRAISQDTVVQARAQYSGKQLALQEQVWLDCLRYSGINATLSVLEGYVPNNAHAQRDHRKRVTELFSKLEHMEAKYPFIYPKLSKEWGSKLISQYRYRKYNKGKK